MKKKISISIAVIMAAVLAVLGAVAATHGSLKANESDTPPANTTPAPDGQTIDPGNQNVDPDPADEPEIKVIVKGGSFEYDGQSHEAAVEVEGLPEGYTFEAAGTTATHVGDGAVKAECTKLVIKDAQAADVTEQFKEQIVYPESDETIQITPKTLTVVTDSASRVFNGEALTAGGSINGFVEGETASFTVTGAQTEAGTSDNTYELKFDQTAVESDYFVDAKVGTLEVLREGTIVVTISGTKSSLPYNGEAQTIEGYTVDSIQLAADGQEYTANDFSLKEGTSASVSGTTAGRYPMGLTAENFVNNNTDYEVAFVVNDGELEITPVEAPITITAGSAEKMYDGTALTSSAYSFTEGVLKGSDVLTAETAGSVLNAGTAPNQIASYKVMNGETDVTNCYSFAEPVNGTLTVTKRDVKLTSASDSKVFDGTALINRNIQVGGSGFADGEGADVNITGTITAAGEADNSFEYSLKSNTLADNYVITTETGKLTVSPISTEVVVAVTGNSASVFFSGYEQSVTGYQLAADNTLYDKSKVVYSGDTIAKGTEVGNYKMGLTAENFTNTDPNFTNVRFVVTDGSLEIKAIPANMHRILIHYVYENGAEAFPDHNEVIESGSKFRINTPALEGFKPNFKFVEGTMPKVDVELKIVFKPIPPEEESTEEEITTTTEDETEVPERETTEEAETEESGSGIEIVPTGDGSEYEINIIEEEKTPGADIDLNMHRCCCLQFLLMAAALIVLFVYTGRRKQNQAKIFELRKQLADERKQKGLDPVSGKQIRGDEYDDFEDLIEK